MPPCLVAIDFGTGAVRSVVFDLRGAQLGASYREIWYKPSPSGAPGAVEFSGSRMWGHIARAVRLALAEAGVRPSDVLAVSATSQRHGMALVDRGGRTLYAGPNRDARGMAVMEAAQDGDVWAITGKWPMPIGVPYRLRWLQRNQPQVLQRASAALMLNDWVAYQLTGEAAQAASSASESLLLDIRTVGWSQRLIDHFGLPRDLFPKVVLAGEVVGRVTAQAAEATGLPQGVPVAAGGGDTQCGLLACGAVDPGDVGIVAGTTAPVQSVVAGPELDPAGQAWTSVHVAPGRWVHESNAGAAGILLRWFRDTFGDGPKRRRPDSYDRLLAPAAAVAPGSDGMMAVMGPAVIEPGKGYSRNRAFVFAPEAPRSFNGAGTRAHFARALVESIVYAIKANFDRLPEVASGRATRVALCGGCARSPLFVQTVADVLDRPIVMPAAQEVTALGAAICAATGAGVYRTVVEAARRMTVVREAARPNAQDAEVYRRQYPRWRALNDAVRGWGQE